MMVQDKLLLLQTLQTIKKSGFDSEEYSTKKKTSNHAPLRSLQMLEEAAGRLIVIIVDSLVFVIGVLDQPGLAEQEKQLMTLMISLNST